jgi:hypothetical protein
VPVLSSHITRSVRKCRKRPLVPKFLRGHRKGMKMMGEETYRSSRNNLSRRSTRSLLSRSNNLNRSHTSRTSDQLQRLSKLPLKAETAWTPITPSGISPRAIQSDQEREKNSRLTHLARRTPPSQSTQEQPEMHSKAGPECWVCC